MINPKFIFGKQRSLLNTYAKQINVAASNAQKIVYNNNPPFQTSNELAMKFIGQSTAIDQAQQLFKASLNDKVQNAIQNIQQYSLAQIAEFFPWVFSSQLLFPPLLQMLYMVKNGIQYTIENYKIVQKLPIQMITGSAQQAIFQSLANRRKFLGIIKQGLQTQKGIGIWSQKLVSLGKDLFYKSLVGSMSLAQKIAKTGINLAKVIFGFKDEIKTTQQFMNMKDDETRKKYIEEVQQQIKKYQTINNSSTFDSAQIQAAKKFTTTYIDVLTKKLKPYGQILINFDYLQTNGFKKKIGSQTYYYMYNTPQLLITNRQAIPQVYIVSNNVPQLITPSTFTIRYLKSLCKFQILKTSGKIYKNLKEQRQETPDQAAGKQSFQNKWINPIVIKMTGIQNYGVGEGFLLDKQINSYVDLAEKREFLKKKQKK